MTVRNLEIAHALSAIAAMEAISKGILVEDHDGELIHPFPATPPEGMQFAMESGKMVMIPIVK